MSNDLPLSGNNVKDSLVYDLLTLLKDRFHLSGLQRVWRSLAPPHARNVLAFVFAAPRRRGEGTLAAAACCQ
jgi:hypothetical protein